MDGGSLGGLLNFSNEVANSRISGVHGHVNFGRVALSKQQDNHILPAATCSRLI